MLIHLAMVAALAAAPATGTAHKPKLIVLDLAASGGVEQATADAMTEALANELAARGIFEVVSSKELQTLIGLERQRQLMGCSEEGACLTELAGALGAPFILRGSLAKLGDAYQLTLQAMDSGKASTLGRSTRLASDLSALRRELPYAVAEATGTPLPPPPSRILPYSLIAAGALAAIGGGLAGVDALSRDRALSRELQNGATTSGILSDRATYQAEIASIGGERTLSLSALLAGALLGGAGLWLTLAEPAVGPAPRVALVPTAGGIALVGVLP